MRLIDADNLMWASEEGRDAAVIRHFIRKQPTVDAVPVVRCKNCQHWGCGRDFETDHVKECALAHYMVGENGYCVYGEAEE